MGTDIIKTLSDGIDMIAKKLGVAVDKIYPVLIKQTQYDMTMDIIWSVISLLIIIVVAIVIRFFYKIYKKNTSNVNDSYSEEHKKRDKQEISLTVIIFSCIAIIVFLTILIACVTEAIQIKINPEWYIFYNYIKPLLK